MVVYQFRATNVVLSIQTLWMQWSYMLLTLIRLFSTMLWNIWCWCSIPALKVVEPNLIVLTRSILKFLMCDKDIYFKRNNQIYVFFNYFPFNITFRAHRNDLENIIPHLIISILYIALDPNPLAAKILFRLFALIRITYTFVYAFCSVPQPTRAITFFLGYGITVYMAFYILVVTFLSL